MLWHRRSLRWWISSLARRISRMATVLRGSGRRILMSIRSLTWWLSLLLFRDRFICWPRWWFVSWPHPRWLLSGLRRAIVSILRVPLCQLMCIFLLQTRVALTDRSFSFCLFPLLPVSHFSLQDCLSFPFLSCPLFVRIYCIVPLLIFGLPLIWWIGSAK